MPPLEVLHGVLYEHSDYDHGQEAYRVGYRTGNPAGPHMVVTCPFVRRCDAERGLHALKQAGYNAWKVNHGDDEEMRRIMCEALAW